MSKKKGEIKEFKPKESSEELTSEEVKARMEQDDKEMEERLAKYAQVMPQIDTSKIEEEEEEEEESYTVDLSKGVVTQNVTNNILDPYSYPPIPGNFTPWIAPDASNPYTKMITDLLVRKAVAKLLKETREAHDKYLTLIESVPSHMRESMMGNEESLWKQKDTLNKIIRGNKVFYEEIPEWVKSYIQFYIEDTLSSLLELTE